MEIVNFLNVKFHDIPEQDNPAFGKQECIMICQEANGKNIVLLHINPVDDPSKEDSVTRLGIFFNEETVINIANNYVNNNKTSLMTVDNMCIESLPPNIYTDWEYVKSELFKNRHDLD